MKGVKFTFIAPFTGCVVNANRSAVTSILLLSLALEVIAPPAEVLAKVDPVAAAVVVEVIPIPIC